jgi:hypothetical protein
MKEVILEANDGGNYIEFKVTNVELKTNVTGLTINYDVLMDFTGVYGSIYETVITTLLEKDLIELGEEYDKVKIVQVGTGKVLFEKDLSKVDNESGFIDPTDKAE